MALPVDPLGGFPGLCAPLPTLLIAGGRASPGLRSGWTNELVRLITLRLITGCHKERTRRQGLEALRAQSKSSEVVRAQSKGSEVEEQPRSRALGLILRHNPPKVVNSLPSPMLLPFPGVVWALTNPPLLSSRCVGRRCLLARLGPGFPVRQ